MTKVDFGRKLKEIRESKGLSQEELALLIGLKDRSSITKIEKGERKMDYDCFNKMIIALGINPLVFFEGNHITLTEHEQEVILAYRNHPEFQPAIDSMLKIEKKTNGNSIKEIG